MFIHRCHFGTEHCVEVGLVKISFPPSSIPEILQEDVYYEMYSWGGDQFQWVTHSRYIAADKCTFLFDEIETCQHRKK
jgi:hypothetical protein